MLKFLCCIYKLLQHSYFTVCSFMWQICGYIPQTIMPLQPDITQKAAQLSTSFFIETFIHAKEKVTKVLIRENCARNFYVIFVADHGTVGRASHKAVQCLPGGKHMVPRTYGQGHLVACTGTAQMSQPNGTTNVSATLHSRHSTFKVLY